MKKVMLGFILGIILCSGIVYGVTLYKSEDIQYQPSDETWQVSNVSDALNDLYDINMSSNKGKLVSGISEIKNGESITLEFDFEPNFAVAKTDLAIDKYNRWNMWFGFLNTKSADFSTNVEVVNDDPYIIYDINECFEIEGNKVTIKNWGHSDKTVTWYVGAY